MKDSPLVRTSTGTSFEASSATGDAVNLYITDVTFNQILGLIRRNITYKGKS